MTPPAEASRKDLIAALDIGSTKVTCVIAQGEGAEGMRVVGIGTYRSSGLRHGVVVDMDATETAVSNAVDAAEQMAGTRISRVILGVSGSQIRAHRLNAEVSVAGHAIQAADVVRVIDSASAALREAEDRAGIDSVPIHRIPVGFAVDGGAGVKDPTGMFGENLSVDILLATAAPGPVRNIETAIQRCHLGIESLVVTAYASGLSCLVDDERDLGVTVVDMGGGTTSVAVFVEGYVVHVGVLPIGGQHVTNDIARGLSTPVASAERLKTLYGHAMHAPSADRELLDVPLIGEDEDGQTNQVPRSMLTQIIRPRLEETFELVRDHLETAGLFSAAGRRVVLTGGASQLNGARDVAAEILQRQVRLGRPLGLKGMPDAAAGPGFAACAGLLRYGMMGVPFDRGLDRFRRPFANPDAGAPRAPRATSRLGRLGQWFKQNF
ncbi:Cell division protein FtsA [uncultured Alphaproteobacteria bacterium]|uniref:Cell division protein FtsA n=1 Tax=uncultured Alphaproteobacteria bacterium TaxID=91750 RepID=A0A212JKF0_9PROT|nr:Cell division protein FtsA [uncultured Alphaproteobacteria bacterium]